jgi:hypothetical protein
MDSCYNAAISMIPTPQLPLYRITLFYGPEPVSGRPPRLTCVFNVKKRSWKGGVQIAVEIDQDQVTAIRQRLSFDSWLNGIVSAVQENERADYKSRAGDLFAQELCSMKLALALERDLRQENSRLEATQFVEELDRLAPAQADRIKSKLLAELSWSEP